MQNNVKRISFLLAVLLCMTAFSMPVYATENGYYASDESGTGTPPDSIDSIIIDTENVTVPDDNVGNALTPDGNMSLIDDILEKDTYASEEDKLAEKQFITVQTKGGNTFYLVIDRAGTTENVYFMNLVDESDLFALIEDEGGEVETVYCTCTDKCMVGSIHTACEICRTNMSECMGKEPVIDKKPEPDMDADRNDTEDPKNEKASGSLVLIVLIAVIGIGGAVYWFKFREKQPRNNGNDDLDFYDFGQEDDNEETEIDDADLMAEVGGTASPEEHEE